MPMKFLAGILIVINKLFIFKFPNLNIFLFRLSIERKTLQWLADICDGDARIALNSLQISFQMKQPRTGSSKSVHISLEDIQEGIKVTKFSRQLINILMD